MKLINWIFAKPKKQQELQQTWTFEHNGWEASAKDYNQIHNIRNGLIQVANMIQEVINENAFLKDENRRLNNELTKHYFATVAKANLLDIIIAEGYILPSTLDKCINQLDEIDQLEIRKAMTNGNS